MLKETVEIKVGVERLAFQAEEVPHLCDCYYNTLTEK